ncbi:MAG: class I SAM-dependent methyltransferase, partial [Myxococcota bacterium]
KTSGFAAAFGSHWPRRSWPFWRMVREALDDPRLDADLERATEVIRARHIGRTWADTVAGQMERHYSPGRTWESMARGLLGFIQLGDVLDVASGDGAVAELLAPRVRSLTCVDVSAQVIRAGERRLGHLPAVKFVQGDMHELPFADAAFDDVLLMNALPYAHDVTSVMREVARVLRPGGRLVGATLAAHDYQDLVAAFDHVGLGFDPDELRRRLTQAGFRVLACSTTHREKRTPHFEVITLHAIKQSEERQ